MPGGADWQIVADDGTIDIDARYVLDLAEGLVEVRSRGVRSGPPDVLAKLARGDVVDPADYYFRTALRFSTVAPSLSRLNQVIAIGRGERLPGKVELSIFEVL
jgi:hypothetical protein